MNVEIAKSIATSDRVLADPRGSVCEALAILGIPHGLQPSSQSESVRLLHAKRTLHTPPSRVHSKEEFRSVLRFSPTDDEERCIPSYFYRIASPADEIQKKSETVGANNDAYSFHGIGGLARNRNYGKSRE